MAYLLLFFGVLQILLLGWIARILIVSHVDARNAARSVHGQLVELNRVCVRMNLADDGRHILGRSQETNTNTAARSVSSLREGC